MGKKKSEEDIEKIYKEYKEAMYDKIYEQELAKFKAGVEDEQVAQYREEEAQEWQAPSNDIDTMRFLIKKAVRQDNG